MTIWLAIFLIIIIASFILAYLSMRDFSEIPSIKKFGIFLIQNPHALTKTVLDHIYSEIKKENQVLSLERLFKGEKSALVIFGPHDILSNYSNILNLLELEDYTNIDTGKVVIWEMGVKDKRLNITSENIFEGLPKLNSDEQIWWQLVLQPQQEGFTSFVHRIFLGKNSTGKKFRCQLRVVIYSGAAKKKAALNNLNLGNIVKIPRPQTSEQLFKNYVSRSINIADNFLMDLNSDEVLKLLGQI